MNFSDFKKKFTITRDDLADFKKQFTVTPADGKELLQPKMHPEIIAKITFAFLGIVLTPITLAGALLGYVHAYNRMMEPKNEVPALSGLRPIMRVAMVAGGILIWVSLFVTFWLLYHVIASVGSSASLDIPFAVVMTYLGINLAISLSVYLAFTRWRNIKYSMRDALIDAANKFGSARWANGQDLQKYRDQEGLYIGGGYTFSDKGHILTCAGTRGGKGTNLIIPNLLGLGGYSGSWVVIDPKGENAAVTRRYQLESGQLVVILNPWDLLHEHVGLSTSYNPLDILSDKGSIHLVDDAQIIAEMLVPIDKNDKDKFFTDNARNIVAGLLVHLVTIQPDKPGDGRVIAEVAGGTYTGDEVEEETDPPPCTLKTLWQWVRQSKDDWDELLAEMSTNEHPVSGEIVRRCAYEILQLTAAGEKTFGNIMATILQCTDFLKSPALQKSLESGFDPRMLSDGNTTMYVIIPADKLISHARWLRLVVTTSMRSVIRKPNKKVCFLLDEFAALGYLLEIETALSTYAGFNMIVWPILQSLIQLKGIYGDKWETFIGNTAVRQYFSVNDNFTASYVSDAIGKTSHMIIKRNLMGKITAMGSNERMLATPDEVRRYSGENIFAFMGEKPPTMYPKLPYFTINELLENADVNPYL